MSIQRAWSIHLRRACWARCVRAQESSRRVDSSYELAVHDVDSLLALQRTGANFAHAYARSFCRQRNPLTRYVYTLTQLVMLLVMLQVSAAGGAAQPVPDHVQRLLRLPGHHLVLVLRRRFKRSLVLARLVSLETQGDKAKVAEAGGLTRTL